MSTVNITKDNFEEVVLKSDKTVLIDFWADWCGPCKMIAPIVEKVADENPDILVGKINVDEELELARQYNVMSIPTLLVFKNGEKAGTLIGVHTIQEITDIIK